MVKLYTIVVVPAETSSAEMLSVLAVFSSDIAALDVNVVCADESSRTSSPLGDVPVAYAAFVTPPAFRSP